MNIYCILFVLLEQFLIFDSILSIEPIKHGVIHQDGNLPKRLPEQIPIHRRNADPTPNRRYDDNNNNNNRRYDNAQNINQFKKQNMIPATTPPLKPKPLVDAKDRLNVYWAEMNNYFALKASADQKFMIRYAPIPRPGSPWPMPQVFNEMNETFLVAGGDLKVKVTMGDGKECALADKVVERFKKNVFGKNYKNQGNSPSSEDRLSDDIQSGVLMGPVYVSVQKGCDHRPTLNMNESYTLRVQRSGIYLWAQEIWGAMRGLETLSQLFFINHNKKFAIRKVQIRDFPRFKHRGVLLDTSRHYMQKKTLLENLEAMAQNKMNVFHWHIVDDQSFPYQSKVFPNLTLKGAYNPYTHIYTQEDIKEIIEYARIRGIRVIPEFDTPGHTFSWGMGQPHLLTPCYDYSGKFNGLYGPINPILKKNYKFLREFFKEVISLFDDDYIHLGGDEVPFDCWYSNPALQSFIRRNNIRDMRQLLTIYAKQLIGIINEVSEKLGKSTRKIVWQEMFENEVKLSPETIVQVWSGDSYTLERVLKSGRPAIFSTCWYLDYIAYGQDWDKYYRCEQLQYHTFANESLFLGGEVCMWAEYVDNDGVMPRLWPRASAAAERLWSDKHLMDPIDAAPRLEMHRCRMMQRGIHVGVASGPGFCDNLEIGENDQENDRVFDRSSNLNHDRIIHNRVSDTEAAAQLNALTFLQKIYALLPYVLVSAIIFTLIFSRHVPKPRCFAALIHLHPTNSGRAQKFGVLAGICVVCVFMWTLSVTVSS